MEQSLSPEVERMNAEELIDNSLSKGHPEENCHRASELTMPNSLENTANKSADSNLISEEITVEVDAVGTPIEKSGIEDNSSSEEATSCTPKEIGCVKSSVASGSETVSLKSSETGESYVSETSQKTSAMAETQSVPVDAQPSTENTSVLKEFTVGKKELDKSNAEKESKDIDEETSSQAMDVTDSSKKIDERKLGDPSETKDVYREAVVVSDTDSDSEDSDSSSVSSLSSPSKSDCESDSDIECLSIATHTKKGTYPVIKAKGELLPEDLPPIEQLHISVPSSLCAEIGVVTSIVKTLVVIQALKGVPPLDLDSVLFLDSGSRALGLVFDVFGPVTEPLYCVRFNSEEQIAEFRVNPGDKVYFAPKTEHSKYVFLQQLMRMKGSDASNQFDVERQVQVEYSDDEEERHAFAEYGDEIRAEEEGLFLDQQKRKRDPNEVVEKKKKFAFQFPPRNQRGGTGKVQSSPRARPRQRQLPRPRQGQQYNPPPHQGPIHPPSFNMPPPPIPGSSVQHQNPPPPPPVNNSQGVFPNQFYQNPVQSASFGQLPFVQQQIDPRFAHFGAQFAQMMCNLQNSTAGGPMGALSTAAPPFTTPFTQSMFTDSQSNFNAFYKLASQGPQSTYSAPPYNAPPPVPQSTLPPTNVPPPGHPPYPPQPNQNATFGGRYSSSYSSYPDFR